ncbi:MAG: ROK family protein [Dehalococcoidia bacterium]
MSERTDAGEEPAVVLGVDIGGTGVKGALVNLATGELIGERFRIPTPQPATTDAIAATVAEITRHFDWHGPIGCTFPGVVKHGVVRTAANVDPSWIGANGEEIIARATSCPVVLLNDADAAGQAEMEFGAGSGENGVALVVTLGTGIGSALFVDRTLVPNTELGHLEMRGKDAEKRASDRARELKGWGWRRWSRELNKYLTMLDRLLSPDLIIIGGGVSRKADKFLPRLDLSTRVVPATLQNEAGIVGAALAAQILAGREPDRSPG